MTSPRVRFAPSPTGYLHVGGARTALFNWLFARHHGGTMVLRIEDTDTARHSPAAMAAIFDGLRWLGIDWDEGPEAGGAHGPYFQSERRDLYDRHLEALTAAGHTFTEPNGAVRFRSPRETIVLDDKICGEIRIDRAQEPDITLRRPDGSYIFHFVNVVDDLEMKITHVIRGEDHIFNTGKHIELFRALGAAPPVYAHIPLILNPDGTKMSKRDKGASVGYYIDGGFIPAAVRNYLCLLGWSPKDEREVLPIEEIVRLFEWSHLHHANAKFDMDKCRWMNGEYLKQQSDEEFSAACRAALKTDALLRLIKPRVRVVTEAAEHLAMLCHGAAPMAPDALMKLAAQGDAGAKLDALILEFTALSEWTGAAIHAAVAAAAASLEMKPGVLMFPLRVAVTGQSHGVDLLPAMEILGKTETLARLTARRPGLAAP